MRRSYSSVEHYMTSDKRIHLAAEVSRLAKIYGDNFNIVESICGNHGSVAQIILAENWIRKTRMPPLQENNDGEDDMMSNAPTKEPILPEAMETAKNWILLDRAKKELIDDGVPPIIAMEITRRVLDADIPSSKQLVHDYYDDY